MIVKKKGQHFNLLCGFTGKRNHKMPLFCTKVKRVFRESALIYSFYACKIHVFSFIHRKR